MSNPYSPFIVGSSDTPYRPESVFVQDSVAYVADSGFGVIVIDVSSPSSPSVMGSFRTRSSANDVFVQGSLVYVADDYRGLSIYEYIFVTAEASSIPTTVPTSVPSVIPSFSPTTMPSAVPTRDPTIVPSISPTGKPSVVPSSSYFPAPTRLPSIVPSPMLPSSYLPAGEETYGPTISSSFPTIDYSTGVPTAVPTSWVYTTTPTYASAGGASVNTLVMFNVSQTLIGASELDRASLNALVVAIANAMGIAIRNVQIYEVVFESGYVISSTTSQQHYHTQPEDAHMRRRVTAHDGSTTVLFSIETFFVGNYGNPEAMANGLMTNLITTFGDPAAVDAWVTTSVTAGSLSVSASSEVVFEPPEMVSEVVVQYIISTPLPSSTPTVFVGSLATSQSEVVPTLYLIVIAVMVLIFLIVVLVGCYCFCCRNNNKGDRSPEFTRVDSGLAPQHQQQQLMMVPTYPQQQTSRARTMGQPGAQRTVVEQPVARAVTVDDSGVRTVVKPEAREVTVREPGVVRTVLEPVARAVVTVRDSGVRTMVKPEARAVTVREPELVLTVLA